jgi:hypothetical protein
MVYSEYRSMSCLMAGAGAHVSLQVARADICASGADGLLRASPCGRETAFVSGYWISAAGLFAIKLKMPGVKGAKDLLSPGCDMTVRPMPWDVVKTPDFQCTDPGGPVVTGMLQFRVGDHRVW